ALAYAGMADAYGLFGFAGYAALPPREAAQRATAAALKALEIDDTLAEAHTALGAIHHRARDWGNSEQEFKRAIQLDPKFGVAYYRLGQVYLKERMYEEAIAEFEEARTLSPDSPIDVARLGYAYAASGREGRAEEILADLREMSKRRYVAPWAMAVV